MNRIASMAPPHLLALDCAIQVVALLLPTSGAAGTGLRIGPTFADVTSAAAAWDGAAWFAAQAAPEASRADLADHVLIARPEGSYLSTDRVELAQMQLAGGALSLTLTVWHVEGNDGEPAPRDLFVLIDAGTVSSTLSRVTIAFDVRHRDLRDQVSGRPAPPDCSLRFH